MQEQQIDIENDFDSKCPQSFICPITSIVMQDPYMDANGISYQKQAIFQWVRKTGRHPTAGRQMKLQQLQANLMLKDVIREYKQKFKDQISYQISRKKFEVSRLNFQAATKLQIDQLESTPGFQDSERKYKTTIEELQKMVESKQLNLHRLRKTAMQNSIKLQEQRLQIKELEEALKRSKQRENQIKNKLKQRQQQIQQLNQKNHSLVTKNQIMKIRESNLLEHLALKMSQKQIIKQELLIAQFSQKGGQKKIGNQRQRNRQENRQQSLQVNKTLQLIVRHVKLTPDKQSRGLKDKHWVIDNTNNNVCIKNTDGLINQWLCSSPLPVDGKFVFTIKLIKLTDKNILIGVMEEGKKGEKAKNTLNYSVYLYPNAQSIYILNEEQTKQQVIKCSCSKQLPQCPFQIECHVNRQQNTIAWHYAGKQQAKSTMPKAWKTKGFWQAKRKQLCAIVFNHNKGDSVEVM